MASHRFFMISGTRCIDGRLFRHDPMPDDPYLETDIGSCPECEGRGCDGETCSICNGPCTEPENEYGEFICTDCEQNRAEAAYERFCEDFHDGGSTQFKSLREQQIEARKFK